MEYRFQNLNEKVIVEPLDKRNRIYRLRYENPFYGSCNLRLRFLRLPDGRPWIDPDSIQVDDCHTRKGDPNSLLTSAQRCLINLTARQPEILDAGEDSLSGMGVTGRLLRWLGAAGLVRSKGAQDDAHKARIT